MSRFVPERVSAIAASASHTPQAAPLSSSVLSSSSSPAFVSTPSAADVEADGDAPDSANPFLTPPDAGGSGSSRANFGQVNAFENAPAHATIEEGSGGRDESRDNGTIAGRTKRIAGKGDGKIDGGRWGLRGVARWGRSSWARGRGTTPVGSSAGSSESAAGEDEGKGELGLTTNLGTIAWAAPEMLVGDGSRGEYTTKVGGVRRVMGSWRGPRVVVRGQALPCVTETVVVERLAGFRGRKYRFTLFHFLPSVAVPTISVWGRIFPDFGY